MSGLAFFEDFVASCAFIHDDWTDHEGIAGWGQYTTNPLLFSPPVSVTGSTAGYGERTVEHLHTLRAFSGQIIQPEWETNDLTRNLRADSSALAALREAVQTRRLHLSSFYNEPARGIDALAASLSTLEHTVQTYPPRDAFLHVNDKLRFADYVEGVPTPQGVICESLRDLRRFAADTSRPYPGLVLKLDHRDIFHVDTPDDLDRLIPKIQFPLLAETCYPLVASPIVNAIRWHGECAPLFTVDQYILNWRHWGNGSPAAGTPEQRALMIEYAMLIGAQMEDYQGVYGVDFILTAEGGVYAVDINARFCSSTYPYALLARNGIDPDRTATRYRLVPCFLESLDDVLGDAEFVPLQQETGRGVFMYDPVSYGESVYPVRYFSYVCAAPTPEDCEALDDRMTDIVERQSNRNRAVAAQAEHMLVRASAVGK